MENFEHRFQHLGQWWYDRTRPQKICIVGGISTVVLIIIIIIASSIVASHKRNICDESSCLEAGARIERLVNFGADPCANISKFACGRMVQQRPINLEEIGQQLLIAAYKEPISKGDHESVKAAKALFQACIQKPQIGQNDLETIKRDLRAAGGYPELQGRKFKENEDFNWVQATSMLRKFGYEYNAFLEVDLITDPDDERKKILQVSLPGLPQSSYGGVTTPFHEMEEFYYVIFGRNNDTLEFTKHFTEILDFQEELINTSYPMDHPSQTDKTEFSKYTVKDYQTRCGESIINWLEFINSIIGPTVKISEDDSILFPPPNYCTDRLNLISNKSKREQANFIMWRALLGVLPYSYLVDTIRFPNKDFLKTNRDGFCLTQTQIRFLPDPVNIMLARKYVHIEQKRAIAELFVAIKMELVEMLKQTAWIYDDEQCAALAKIRNLKLTMAYFGDYFNNQMLDNIIVDMIELKETPNFLERLAQANRNSKSAVFKEINQSLQMDFAFSEESLYFPSYHYHINTLLLPLTVLNSTGFQHNLPRYINYAAMGSFIGYYLVDLITARAHHQAAFDAKVHDWSPHSLKKKAADFDERILEGMHLSQMLVSQQLAYAAYDKWAKENDEELKLESIRQYTSRQAFWISAATNLCKHVAFDGVDLIFTNSTLLEIILNTSIRHNSDFARDFNCPKTSPNDLPDVCSVI